MSALASFFRKHREKGIFRYYIDNWQYAMALIVLIPSISVSSLFFLEIFFSGEKKFNHYTANIPAIIFWALALPYLVLNRLDQKWKSEDEKEEKVSNDDKFKKLTQSLSHAPDFNSFPRARTFFDSVTIVISELENSGFLMEFENKNFENIDELEIRIVGILKLIINFHKQFFTENELQIAANIMIYFEQNEDNAEVIEKVCRENTLYFIAENHDKLLGALFLAPKLLAKDRKQSQLEIPSVSIPIYSNDVEIYNEKNFQFLEFSLPGAPVALKHGASLIPNTADENSYNHLKDEYRKEISGHFRNNVKNVRSVASFRIPSLPKNGEDIEDLTGTIAILNIDVSKAEEPSNEAFFNTFYTLIYPSLCNLSKYLSVYKEYIKSLDNPYED